VSSLVHDAVVRSAGGNTVSDYAGGVVPAGRHAFIEDAAMTPIFNAIARGEWRTPEPEAPALPAADADPVETFHADPLLAPIPVQALVPAPSEPWRPLLATVVALPAVVPDARSAHGRHHFRTEQAPARL
jgi:hypothetical protein